jgi:hypothetical protein
MTMQEWQAKRDEMVDYQEDEIEELLRISQIAVRRALDRHSRELAEWDVAKPLMAELRKSLGLE